MLGNGLMHSKEIIKKSHIVLFNVIGITTHFMVHSVPLCWNADYKWVIFMFKGRMMMVKCCSETHQ